MKTCKACKSEKQNDCFYAHPKAADGFDSTCKECRKERVRANRREKIEYYREYDRLRSNIPKRVLARAEYAKTENGIIACNLGKSAWAERNPKKKAASTAVGNAVRDGKMTKKPCEICGSTKRTHGHHDDYDKVYDVRWLCPQHHRDWHKEHGEALNPR